MARVLLAFWRCKCGIRVKVVAEEDASSSNKQIASCPKCREPHEILADKIISVTEDIFEDSPAAVSCGEKERLLVAQNKAFDIYRRGASRLAEATATVAHADYEFLASRVRAARQSFLEMRKQFDEHTAKHGC
jgi:hypothetical protein